MNPGEFKSPKISPEDDELLTELLEKIRKPFEDLESLLLGLDENSRIRYLTETIATSFLSSDPPRIIQDTVDLVRTFKFKKKLVGNISRSNNIKNLVAYELLFESLKIGRYYRNKTKS